MHPGKRSTWDSGNWRPDIRASAAGAAAAALLVMAGFAALFSATPKLSLSRDANHVEERLVFAAAPPPPPPPILRPRTRPPAPAASVPMVQSAWPPLPAPVAAPGGFSSRDYLDERARGNAAALRDQVTGSELKRDLDKQTEKPAVSDNQSYRTVDGQKVVRSGGGCAQIQTVQGSSSPTNRIDVAEPTACPGATPDAGQEMGKALDDWAKKVQQSLPPPP